MNTEWREVFLDEVTDCVTVGHVGPMADQYVSIGIPFLRSLNIQPFRINKSELKFITPKFHSALRNSSLRPGDVVIVRTGKPGSCAVIPDWLSDANCSDLVIVRCGRLLRPTFLTYVVNSVAAHHIDTHLVGAVQQHFNVGSARKLRFKLPSLDEQDRIIDIFDSLDGKIDLNRQMNETLEAMGRAIFRDWFVDFGPVRAKIEGRSPYLPPALWALFPRNLDGDEKPSGWKVLPLDEMADFLNGLALQKFPGNGDGDLPVIKIAELRSGLTTNTDWAASSVPRPYVVEDGDILFSWSGSLIQKIWTGGCGALNQHLFKVTSSEFPKWLHYLWVDHHLPAFQAIASSKATTMGHIQRYHLREAQTVIGDQPVMKAADELIAPLFDRLIANDLESRTLAQIRDLLLPKLISGEIRLKEAQKMVEAVA